MDDDLRRLEQRAQRSMTAENVLALARAYERAGLAAGRPTTGVTIGPEAGSLHLVFAHEKGVSPDAVKARMRDAIRARFSSQKHQDWLRGHGNLNWIMGAAAVPDEEWSKHGLDLLSKSKTALSIDDDEVVMAPELETERVDAMLLLDNGTGTLEDVAPLNVVRWLRQADHDDLEQLVRDEWTGGTEDGGIGDAAQMAAESDPEFAVALAAAEASGRPLRVSVDDEQGARWIWDNQPRLARRIFD